MIIVAKLYLNFLENALNNLCKFHNFLNIHFIPEMLKFGLMESIFQERSSSEILFRTKDKKSFSTDSLQLVQCSPFFNVLLNSR